MKDVVETDATLEEGVETDAMVVVVAGEDVETERVEEVLAAEDPKAVAAPRNRRASMSKMRVPFLHYRKYDVSIKKYSFRYCQGAVSCQHQTKIRC